jgi:hypothetical protein
LSAYVYPSLGCKSVADIDKRAIVACLKPLWVTKPETAKRVRARIEQILARATALDLRQGDNPASWSLLRHLPPVAQGAGGAAPRGAALRGGAGVRAPVKKP